MDNTKKSLALANRIRSLREQAGLSQKELADKLGISRVAVTKYESGESTPARRLKVIADIFGVSVDYLLRGEECTTTTTTNTDTLGVGNRIRLLRKQKHLDKSALAKLCDVTTRTVTSWEDGTTQPSLVAVTKLARIFDVSTDYILGITTQIEEVPEDSSLFENILEQVYADNPELLKKLTGAQVYSDTDLNSMEKEFLKSNLDIILKAKGLI